MFSEKKLDSKGYCLSKTCKFFHDSLILFIYNNQSLGDIKSYENGIFRMRYEMEKIQSRDKMVPSSILIFLIM